LGYALEQKNYARPSKKNLASTDLKIYNYLCLTGEGFEYLFKNQFDFLKKIIAEVKVFARVSPKQKEHVITILKSLGYVTLMCGDGTNDVGALKHSHVGVALLSSAGSNDPEAELKRKAKISEAQSLSNEVKTAANALRSTDNRPHSQNSLTSHHQQQQQSVVNAQKKLALVLKELEEADQMSIVKLGDASIASPFTYKQSSIQCVCHIIKQGRCTLVTTLQMFKILALNALILAYSQSVLYLDGVKLSDGQATMQGLLLAGCFLFISRSKPLKTLSKSRPLPDIFNLYTVITVLSQFAIHLASIIYLVNEARSRSPPREEKFVKLDKDFEPSLVNSTVYIISLSLQVSTFAINHKGHPFMESLKENKALLYSIIFSASAAIALALGTLPDLNTQFQIIDFPSEFRTILLTTLFVDFGASYLVDRILAFLFGNSSVKKA
jgi:cation-transporting ATPase 13A1